MLNCRGILKQKRMKCLRVIVKRKRWYFKTWNKLLKKELMRIQAWLLLKRSSQRGLLLKVLEQNVSKSFHRNKFCSTSNLLLRLFFVCKCLVPYLVICWILCQLSVIIVFFLTFQYTIHSYKMIFIKPQYKPVS